jgi:ankyrin repeat protein
MWGQPDIVQLLLEAGADVSIGDKMAEHTPLHLACVAGNVQVVQLLLEYGANAEQVDKAGFYPFHHAVAHKNKEVVAFLLTRGGFDPNIASHKDGARWMHKHNQHSALMLSSCTDSPSVCAYGLQRLRR